MFCLPGRSLGQREKEEEKGEERKDPRPKGDSRNLSLDRQPRRRALVIQERRIAFEGNAKLEATWYVITVDDKGTQNVSAEPVAFVRG